MLKTIQDFFRVAAQSLQQWWSWFDCVETRVSGVRVWVWFEPQGASARWVFSVWLRTLVLLSAGTSKRVWFTTSNNKPLVGQRVTRFPFSGFNFILHNWAVVRSCNQIWATTEISFIIQIIFYYIWATISQLDFCQTSLMVQPVHVYQRIHVWAEPGAASLI